MRNLFNYFVENHSLHLTEGELEDIRCAVRADILPSKTALHAERADAAIRYLLGYSPLMRYSPRFSHLKDAVATLMEIAGMEVPHG